MFQLGLFFLLSTLCLEISLPTCQFTEYIHGCIHYLSLRWGLPILETHCPHEGCIPRKLQSLWARFISQVRAVLWESPASHCPSNHSIASSFFLPCGPFEGYMHGRLQPRKVKHAWWAPSCQHNAYKKLQPHLLPWWPKQFWVALAYLSHHVNKHRMPGSLQSHPVCMLYPEASKPIHHPVRAICLRDFRPICHLFEHSSYLGDYT